MKNLRLAAAAALVAMLAACGGGGGGGDSAAQNSAPTTTKAGLWNGSTSTGRSVSALTFNDGTVWAMYSPVGNPGYIAGAVQGNMNGAATDYNLEGFGITAGTLSTTVNSKQSIGGTLSAGSTSLTFSGTYSTDFDKAPTLTPGTYTGTAVVAGGSEAASVTVASSGALSGVSASGCRYSGTATARTDGNAFDIQVTFQGGVCALGTSTVTGVSYVNTTTKRIYAAALNSSRTNGFMFSGVTP